MKKMLVLLFAVSMGFAAFSQSADEQILLNNAKALTKAIFETKDSMALNKLLDAQLTYAHSGGNVENKSEMMHKAVNNKTTYANVQLNNETVVVKGKTAIVRHIFSAVQTLDGKTSDLKLNVMQVWVKEKKDWLLLGRHSLKMQ